MLRDGRGIPCPICLEAAAIEIGGAEVPCEFCEEGRILETLEITADAQELALVVLMSRERAWSAIEWLDQPFTFSWAWRFLMPYVTGEFEERREAARKEG